MSGVIKQCLQKLSHAALASGPALDYSCQRLQSRSPSLLSKHLSLNPKLGSSVRPRSPVRVLARGHRQKASESGVDLSRFCDSARPEVCTSCFLEVLTTAGTSTNMLLTVLITPSCMNAKFPADLESSCQNYLRARTEYLPGIYPQPENLNPKPSQHPVSGLTVSAYLDYGAATESRCHGLSGTDMQRIPAPGASLL